jgi:hypothetical protein
MPFFLIKNGGRSQQKPQQQQQRAFWTRDFVPCKFFGFDWVTPSGHKPIHPSTPNAIAPTKSGFDVPNEFPAIKMLKGAAGMGMGMP